MDIENTFNEQINRLAEVNTSLEEKLAKYEKLYKSQDDSLNLNANSSNKKVIICILDDYRDSDRLKATAEILADKNIISVQQTSVGDCGVSYAFVYED